MENITCSHEVLSHPCYCNFDPCFDWYSQCSIMVHWGGILTHTPHGSSERVKAGHCHLSMGHGTEFNIFECMRYCHILMVVFCHFWAEAAKAAALGCHYGTYPSGKLIKSQTWALSHFERVWKGVWNNPTAMRCCYIILVVSIVHYWAKRAKAAVWCIGAVL